MKPTNAEYLAESILNHIPTDDAGSRALTAAIEVVDYLVSEDGSHVLAAINDEAQKRKFPKYTDDK